jgi:hypothetical protein
MADEEGAYGTGHIEATWPGVGSSDRTTLRAPCEEEGVFSAMGDKEIREGMGKPPLGAFFHFWR